MNRLDRWGEAVHTVQFAPQTTDSLGNDFAGGERAAQPFTKAMQQPSRSPPISRLLPAPRVLS